MQIKVQLYAFKKHSWKHHFWGQTVYQSSLILTIDQNNKMDRPNITVRAKKNSFYTLSINAKVQYIIRCGTTAHLTDGVMRFTDISYITAPNL